MRCDVKKEFLKKKELLDFLSELLTEVFEEQGQIRKQIQNYNDEIKKNNQCIAELISKDNIDENSSGTSARMEEEQQKKEYLLKISTLQTKIFDLQDRMVYIQDRIEKIKSLSLIVDEQIGSEVKKEDGIFEKIRSLEIQEVERKRISMELHDTTVQNLTTLVHKIEFCLRLIDRDIIRAKMEMQGMTDTLRKTINELREMIYQLRPMSIDDIGLVATLQRFIKQNELENGQVKITLHVINEEKYIKPVINITLYRIIEEAFQNTKKHANATEFTITILYEEDYINLLIQDDGVGFDYQPNRKKYSKEDEKHFGLSIMKERVDLLSGKIQIKSKKGRGTKIQIEVPVL